MIGDKMKKIRLYILGVLMACSITSCLDKYPENAILADKAITTIDEADQAVIGIYSSFLRKLEIPAQKSFSSVW